MTSVPPVRSRCSRRPRSGGCSHETIPGHPRRAGRDRRLRCSAIDPPGLPHPVGLPGLAASGPYRNAADVVLEQAIRTLPLFPAASSAYTYRWDAAQGTLVRVDDAVSAWPFTERGQTLGEGLLNVGVTWGYYDVDSVNGHDLGHDPFPVSVCCGSK